MTLKIVIENIDQEESVRICKACVDEVEEINLRKSTSEPQIVMKYECGTIKPNPVYRESTPFSRYINGGKEGEMFYGGKTNA